MSEPAKNRKSGGSQEVVGSGISDGVANQFKLRENLISDRSKSRDHLLFFNGNGAWARLVSSVNTLTEREATELAAGKKTVNDTVGDNSLAWNNVMMGGTLKQGTPKNPTSLKGGVSQDLHSPIEIDKDGYIKSGDLRTNTYHKYGSLGFRPTPGLESVSVESKGTYGTLREASINFKVWTLEDLEVAQALYLRPGYTVLVEWGHSLQLVNESKAVNSDIELIRSFLNDKISDPMLKFEKELNEKRKDSNYNYDGFVGYVSNFQWSINSQGGYDCSIKVISKGSVLESIAVTFDPVKAYPADQIASYKTDKGKNERKSIFHKLFSEIQRWINEESNSAGGQAVAAGLGISTIAPAAGVGLVTLGIGDAIGDTLFGSDEELQAQAETTAGTEAQFAQQNQAFVNRLNKILNGDKFTFEGKEYSFSKIEQGRRGIADLEEEELVYYLNLNFEKYGIKVVEGSINILNQPVDQPGDSITLYTEEDISNRIFVGVDNTFTADDYRTSFEIYNFIKANAKLPENLLTTAQREDRKRREQIAAQQEIDNKKAQEIAKASGADIEKGSYIQPIYTNANFVSPTSKHFRKTLNNFCAFRLKDLEKKGTGFDNDDLNEFWLPLGVILDVYNNYVSIADATNTPNKGTKTQGRKLTQFYTGWQDDNAFGKYEKEAKYITGPSHFSINPMVCVLPKFPKLTSINNSQQQPIKWPNGAEAYQMGVIWKNGFHPNVEAAFRQGLLRGEPDDILNILVSVEFLKRELDKIVEQDDDSDQSNETNNIVSFMKTVLRAMNEAMGGINDLDLFYEETDDLYFIVDRKKTPVSEKAVPKLSLSGLKSTMTDVNISSQISKNIGNMVSIAAQGTGGNAKENVGPLLKWNSGLLDRHVRHKTTNLSDKDKAKIEKLEQERLTSRDEKLKSWIDDYYDYWEEFNGEKAFDNGDFNEDIVPSLSNYHKEFSQQYVVETYSKDEKDPKPVPGVIPVELNFTTMGISGLKIGQAFTIEQGLLPARYAEDYGYIITGLSHEIADSKWTTSVKTQFYMTKKPSKVEIDEHKKTTSTEESKFVQPEETRDDTPGPVVTTTSGDASAVTGKTITSGFPLKDSAWQNVEIDKSQVMIHWTAGNQRSDKGKSTVDTLNQRGVSYHYIIDAAGHVESIVPEKSRAYHAGGSGSKKISANTNSIGISLMNLGYCRDADNSSYGKVPEGQTKCVRLVDHNGNPTTVRGQKWNQEVTDAQLVALESLLKGIRQRNPRIPAYRWQGKSTYDQFFPPTTKFTYEKNKPGYYSHCSSNKGKVDMMPTPKIVNFLKRLKL